MGKKASTGSSRTRNYATVVYPESAPDNWIYILSECVHTNSSYSISQFYRAVNRYVC